MTTTLRQAIEIYRGWQNDLRKAAQTSPIDLSTVRHLPSPTFKEELCDALIERCEQLERVALQAQEMAKECAGQLQKLEKERAELVEWVNGNIEWFENHRSHPTEMDPRHHAFLQVSDKLKEQE